MKLIKIIAIVIITFLFCDNSYAAEKNKSKNQNQNKNFLSKYKKELNAIENYLQNINYLEADFLQESSEGNIIEGKFYLSRGSGSDAGKMRIEYNQPSKILIIVNGNVLTYQDLDLEETSYFTTNSTPASFLVRKNISFAAKDIKITNVKKTDDLIKVSIIKKNRPEAGEFSLIFAIDPFKFLRLEVKNDLDQITKITFVASKLGEKISDQLFIIKNDQLPQ